MKCQISAQVLYYVISQYNKKSFIYCILAYTFYSRKKTRDTFLHPALWLNYFVTFTVVLYTAFPDFTVITALPVFIPFTLPFASTVAIFLLELV